MLGMCLMRTVSAGGERFEISRGSDQTILKESQPRATANDDLLPGLVDCAVFCRLVQHESIVSCTCHHVLHRKPLSFIFDFALIGILAV